MGVLLKMGKCNITLSFECDRSWEDLTRTEGEHRFCDGCQENVYWVSSDQEGEDHTRLGHCIAFRLSEPKRTELMGYVLPRTPPPPPPPRRRNNPG
jgi:hypothetical protein